MFDKKTVCVKLSQVWLGSYWIGDMKLVLYLEDNRCDTECRTLLRILRTVSLMYLKSF